MQWSNRVSALWATVLSGAVFLSATAGMLVRLEPFYTWYYLFCWWCFIIFFEGFLRLKGGRSELFDDPVRFCLNLPLSIVFWLVFEMLNFRVQNWHYSGVPSERWLRWTGYALSFATVLPGLTVTQNIVDRFTEVGKRTGKLEVHLERFHPAIVALGACCLILPLSEPRLFFPLIWLAFIFLLDPLNFRLGARSLLRDLEVGFYQRLFQLPLAGLLCGVLWETWNFGAGARWTYTIPFVGFLRVFEMPVLGFLGFLPFAIEAHVMTSTAWAGIQAIGRMRSQAHKVALWVVLVLVVLLFVCSVFQGIDRLTVLEYRT